MPNTNPVRAANLPDPLAAALLAPAREAFTSGMHATATISAVLLAAVAVLVVTLLREVRPSSEPAATQETSDEATARPGGLSVLSRRWAGRSNT